MRFPVLFTRRIGGSGAVPLLGSDSAPTVSSAAIKTADNLLSHKLARPTNRVALGYRFSAGSGVDLPAAIYVWDEKSSMWFKSDYGTLKDGEITYLQVPVLDDPPQVAANQGQPQH